MTAWLTPPKKPLVTTRAVNIWRILLKADSLPIEQLLVLLSDDERARTERFHRSEDRARFIIARAAVREVLECYLSVPAGGLRFEYSPTGKPSVAGQSGVHFNLSHSGALALLAVADYPVGIDIEWMHPDFDFTKIAIEFFSPDEVGELNETDAASRVERFFSLWTRKEAVLKAIGTGLAGLDIGVVNDGWNITEIDAAPGYAAAVAHQCEEQRYWQWSGNEVLRG